MMVIRQWKTPWNGPPTFVAIGCFDGVHLAHQKVLQTVVDGKSVGLTPAVFTFDSNPDSGKGVPSILSTEEKLRILEEMGIEVVFLLRFDDVREMTPEVFVETVLRQSCGAKQICCGYNFHFGKGGRADADTLCQLCGQWDIGVTVIDQLTVLGQPVSSTRIRELIRSGEMEKATQLLGRPFSFTLPVVHGQKLGRKIGVPTMNQQIPADFVQPKNGVYCSETVVDGTSYRSVTNVGVKPTVGGDTVAAETWIQDFSGDLYGRTVQVSLLHFLRPEEKFPSLEALQSQILKDKVAAEQYWRQKK